MQYFSLLLFASLAFPAANAQTYVLTGCHQHGGTEYCYLPNGSEVPFTRTGSTVPTSTGASTTPAAAPASTTPAAIPASITGCHAHADAQYCLAAGKEWHVMTPPAMTPLPTAYSGCHLHAAQTFCFGPSSIEVQVSLEVEATGTATGASPSATGSSTGGLNCHFHAGVEHCVADGESESGSSGAVRSCDIVTRDYNIPLRVGLLFVILVASGIAVFSPILLRQFTAISLNSIVFIILKQFGTGIIISTALVHLLTHAELMFSNECLGPLLYEAVTTSIVMAGLFLSFLIEFIGTRLVARRAARRGVFVDAEQSTRVVTPESQDGKVPAQVNAPNTTLGALGHAHGAPSAGPDSHFSVLVMEAGIVFHSILIGLTLVVAGDSFFTTLFIVILFHQMFEGLALGTRIASLPHTTSLLVKSSMAIVFTLITPIGMAIGIGVLNRFNGNDPKTIVAIGTLDALSAGILLWVGLVQMWSHDWLSHGAYMARPDVGFVKILVGVLALVAGMVLMSFLGKWA